MEIIHSHIYHNGFSSVFLYMQLCKTVWGPKKTKSLASWSLGSKPKKALWKKCDKSFICSAPIVTVKPVFVGAPGLRGPPGLRD